MRGGLLSFSKYMLYRIYTDNDLYIGFKRTQEGMIFESPTYRRYIQARGNEPVMDASGDGVYSESEDGGLVAQKYVGTKVGLGDFAPVVEWTGQVSSVPGLVTYLASAGEAKIEGEREKARGGYRVGLSGAAGDIEVRARISDPEGELKEGFAVLVSARGEVLDTIAMLGEGGSMYSGRLTTGSMTRPERYAVVVFGVDRPENVSIPDPDRLLYFEKNEVLSFGSLEVARGDSGWLEVGLMNSAPVAKLRVNFSAGSELRFEMVEGIGEVEGSSLVLDKGLFGGGSVVMDMGGKTLSSSLRERVIMRLKVSLSAEGVEADSIIVHPTLVEMWDEKGAGLLALGVAGVVKVGKPVVMLPCDVTGDKVVNIFDVLLVVKFALGQQVPTADQLRAADVNGDGVINIFDVLGCVNKALGKELMLAGVASNNLSRFDMVGLEKDLKNLGADEALISDVKELLSQAGMRSRLPKVFSLSQNYPNPFNPSTAINYSIPEGEKVRVRLEIYNLRGQLVKVIVGEDREAGEYRVHWDGRDERGGQVPSGVYFYRIRAGKYSNVRKMILLR